tara:strand:+ start:537 stop:1454 length:918 start_codon:yes stop_codon:yes gene_type:complete
MGERLYVNEVGLRDGLQIHPHFVPTDDKLRLIEALIDAGVESFEATSFVSPKAVPQMADAGDLFVRLPQRERVAYHALVPNERGYDRALESGVTSVAVVLAASDTLNRKNINMTLDEAVVVCTGVLGRANTDGVAARAYVSAACGCPYEGHVEAERVIELAERMFDAGAQDVAIADSIGAGNPTQIGSIFGALAKKHDTDRLSGHFHDTRAMGLAMTWASIAEGIRRFDSSIGGLGGCPFAPGASGNLATEDLVYMVNQSGFETGIDVDKLRIAVSVASQITSQHLGGRIADYFESQEQQAVASA